MEINIIYSIASLLVVGFIGIYYIKSEQKNYRRIIRMWRSGHDRQEKEIEVLKIMLKRKQ